MNTDVKSIESSLKDIITKNEDAVKGFEKAAERAKEIGVKNFFSKRAKHRRMLLEQLKNASPELNLGNEEISGSTTGAAHRTWMDVKAFFSGDNDEAMLEEAVRGDKAAIQEYNEVLSEVQIPARIKEILREQKDAIQNDIETSEILEDYR